MQDEIVDRERAVALHLVAPGMPMWVVTSETTDYPSGAVARLHIIAADGSCEVSHCILVGETLPDLRSKLPPGLACLPRHSNDDPVIVETWF